MASKLLVSLKQILNRSVLRRTQTISIDLRKTKYKNNSLSMFTFIELKEHVYILLFYCLMRSNRSIFLIYRYIIFITISSLPALKCFMLDKNSPCLANWPGVVFFSFNHNQLSSKSQFKQHFCMHLGYAVMTINKYYWFFRYLCI